MPKVKSKSGREVLYHMVTTNLCDLNSKQAKEILGWEPSDDGEKISGQKVVMHNNITNRPIYQSTIDTLSQEILRGRWQLNGEPIIIGRTGLVLNGQHTLLALIAAEAERQQNKEKYEEYWTRPCKINKVVVFGIGEVDQVVNTMDTCKPRSLADVLYRSKLFADLPKGPRKKVAKITDYAVRTLWERTGAGLDAFSLRRTHSESLDFVERHLKLLDCVDLVYQLDQNGGKLTAFLPLGHCAGLLYLMGSSTSNSSRYADQHDESVLTWRMYKKAKSFFVDLANGDKGLFPICQVIADLVEAHGVLPKADRAAIILKAWLLWSQGKPVKLTKIRPDYDVQNGERVLIDQPVVGGIDLGVGG